MDAVRDAVVDYMNQYRVSSYDEGSGKGLVRHIYVRKGWVSGQLLVCLVVNGDKLPPGRRLYWSGCNRSRALLLWCCPSIESRGMGFWGETFLHPVRPGLD